MALVSRRAVPTSALSPADILDAFAGPEVPDPITFVIGEQWLDRGNLYPRQATLLKLIFLRTDLFTDYDHMVLNEWITSFAETGDNGTQTDLYRRIEILKADGYRWFREVLLVMGRRAGKGHVSGLAKAYVLWNYLAKGDPQGYYGVDRDKQLACFVFAGKKEQARLNLFADLYNVINSGPCFAKYISRAQTDSLTIYAPHDFLRMRKLAERGVTSSKDMATFLLQPKESTLMAGRGPASFMQGYDEMAHVVASGANRSAEDVYGAATPALDQFGKDAFIIAPSSPWQKAGQFYENYVQGLEVDAETGDPVYPERLILQLTSWDIYKDWEIAHEIDLFPEGFQGDLGEYADRPLPRLRPLKGAIQTYDLAMQRLEKANPETFAVERRARWATVMDAYLNEAKVEQIFKPWLERPEEYGRPMLEMQESGLLIYTYKAHADPSKSNCFAGETRYLTQEGLKSFQETVGTTQRVLGRYGRWVDATVVQAPPERLLRLVVRRQGVDREIFATANHRFPVRVKYSRKNSEVIKTTEELMPGDRIPNRFAAWNPRTTPYPAGIQAGIVYGDGSMTSYGGSHVPLWGEKDAALLKWFPHNATKAVVSAQGCPGVDVFQLPGFFKRDPDLREARGYLLGWLMGYFAADGTVFENGSACFTSRKRHSLEVALTVCDLLGIPHYDIREHNGPGYNGDQPCYYMTIDTEVIGEEFFLIEVHRERVARRNHRPRRRLPEWTVVSVEETDRVEPVYCVQVPDGERFTLEGNIDVYNCNFGLAIGHAERDANGVLHCVFDRLHHWEPSSWEDGIVDYDEIGDYMVDEVAHKFYPDEITFDQFNSVATIQKINKRLLNEEGPKKVIAYERTATKELNWSRAEVFKTAINMGLVHAPYYEQAENELKFLIDKGNKTVDCPDTGPVQTKDVADCMFEVVYYFLGKQVQEMLAALGAERIRGGMQGGTLGIQKTPQTHQASPNDLFSDFGVGRRMAVQQMGGLNRGYRRRY